MDIKYSRFIALPNRLFTAFVLNLIYSTIFIDFHEAGKLITVIQLILNYVMIYCLQVLIDTMLEKYLKPSGFIHKDKMTIKHAIEVNTTSWGRGMPQLHEQEYKEKYNYRITITRLIIVTIVYFFLLGIFSWVKVFLLFHNTDIVAIDFFKAGYAVLLLLFYFALLITSGIWIYDKENSIHNRDSFIYPVLTIGLSVLIFILILKSYV